MCTKLFHWKITTFSTLKWPKVAPLVQMKSTSDSRWGSRKNRLATFWRAFQILRVTRSPICSANSTILFMSYNLYTQKPYVCQRTLVNTQPSSAQKYYNNLLENKRLMKGISRMYLPRCSSIYGRFCTLYQVQQHLSEFDGQKSAQREGTSTVDQHERWQNKPPQVKWLVTVPNELQIIRNEEQGGNNEPKADSAQN